MTTPASSTGSRKGSAALIVWSTWAFTVALAAFAFAATNIPFSNKEISLPEAFSSAEWSKILSRDALLFWLLVAASFFAVLAWFRIKNPRTRLWFTAVVSLIPVIVAAITLEWDKVETWFLSFVAAPAILYEMLFQKLDGEFYAEATLMFAALGWWSLLWLGLLFAELRKHATRKSVISPYSFPAAKSR